MEIEPCTPHPLPIKDLKWEKIISLIGEAREALGRYDETLKRISSKSLKTLQWQECVSSLRGEPGEKTFHVHEGLEFAIQWAKKKPLNLQFLCQVHAIVKKDGSNPKAIGRLRTKQNWIGPQGCSIDEGYFFPPKSQTVKRLMQALFRYLRGKEKDPLVQLAIFFAQLLIIHPFMDGNGRVARIFIPVWLWKKKLTSKPALFMSSYFAKNRLQYFRKLFYISEKDAWEDWITYFLKGVIEQSSCFRSSDLSE
jgi:Fic family protein